MIIIKFNMAYLLQKFSSYFDHSNPIQSKGVCVNYKPVFAGALCGTLFWCSNAFATNSKAVVEHYANIASAVYEDALTSAMDLHKAAQNLVANPSENALQQARGAWREARVPYQQSEVFRFGNIIVDDWEGQLNAWPLDEGLIDYVAASYHAEMGNVAGTANIIAHPKLTIGNTTLDLSSLTPEVLADLNELGGSEANVTTGYHAVEFLLWGQDLNGTSPGAGKRPFTDYARGKQCTNNHCERRGEYLLAATQLLVNDLQFMVAQWQTGNKDNYRTVLLKNPSSGLQKMLFGMGSLSLGELAGERLKVPLEAGSTEDEHDCFSDNTHNSHYYNAKGIENIYFGRYQRSNGELLEGPALQDLIKAKDADLNKQAEKAFATTEAAFRKMVDTAEKESGPVKFDQMIAEDNKAGQAIIIEAINALVAQTRIIEHLAKTLGIAQLNPDTADHQF